MIKHLSFDLWGTLITSHPHYRSIRRRLLESIFEVSVPESDATHGKIMVDLVSEISGIQLTYEQTVALTLGASARKIKKENFIELVAKFRKLNEEMVEMYHPTLITPDIVDLLEKLKDRGYSMNILSNTSIIPGSALRTTLKKLEIDHYFEHKFFSDEEGLAKPNPEFYKLVPMHTGHAGVNILHIGDNPFTDSGIGMMPSYILTNQNQLSSLLTYLNQYNEV